MTSRRFFWRLCFSNLSLVAASLTVVLLTVPALENPARSGVVVGIAGVLLVILAIAQAYFAYRRFLLPVDQIRQAASEYVAGRRELHLYIDEPSEFRELAEVMNSMAAQLEKRLQNVVSQNEEREAILSSMLEGVIAIDLEERILRFNRAAAAFLEVPHRNCEGRNVFEVVRSATLQKLIRDVATERALVEREIVVSGEPERYLQVSGRPLQSTAGEELGILLVLHDVTRVRRLESMRRDFVANVSHELRTPVTSIRAAAETLLEGALEHKEDARRFADMISRQATRLNRIIEDLLKLATLENMRTRQEIVFEPLNVGVVVNQSMEDCRTLAASKNVSLQCIGDSSATLRGNSTLITQALVNLLSNAIDYSEPGEAVTINCFRNSREITISVVDQGCGIEEQHHERLFERFYRVDKARSRKSGGTGLGLAIVKHVAEAHGGQVTVKSAPGMGSTFSIVIPLSR